MTVEELNVVITAKTEQLQSELNGVKSKMSDVNANVEKANSSIISSMKKVATAVGTAFAVKKIVDFGKQCVNAAAALEQVQKKTSVIFGDMADDVADWALQNERYFGLGSGTIQGFMNDIADITQGMGMAKDVSVDMAKSATELGVQLANWNGIDAADAINDIQKAMTGSTEGLEKYGIKINDAAKEQAMLSLGLRGTYDDLDNATKAQVIFQAALDASGNAVDYWNEGNRSMSFYMNEIKEQFGNITEVIGAVFLPIVTNVLSVLGDFVSFIAANAQPAIDALGEKFTALKDLIMPVIDTVKGFLLPIFEKISTDAGGSGSAIEGMGIVLKNTFDFIVSVVKSVAIPIFDALKEVVKTAYEFIADNMDSIKEAVKTAFDKIKTLYTTIFKPVFELVIQIVKQVWGVFKEIMPVLSSLFKDVVSTISTQWNKSLKPVFEAIQGFIQNTLKPVFEAVFTNFIAPLIKNTFAGIKTAWTDVLKPVFEGICTFLNGAFTGNWAKAWEGVKSIVVNVFNGIKTAVKTPINAIIDMINNSFGKINISIPDWVPVVGGKGWSFPKIPKLEYGAGLAEKGKQYLLEGAGDEAVIPLGQDKGAITKIADAILRGMGNAGTATGNIVVQLTLDGKTIANKVIDTVNKETRTTGYCPIVL